jgi:hypothetical protein
VNDLNGTLNASGLVHHGGIVYKQSTTIDDALSFSLGHVELSHDEQKSQHFWFDIVALFDKWHSPPLNDV